MSSELFLLSDYQSIVKEARRHPQVKEAAEKALVLLKKSSSSSPAIDWRAGGQNADTLTKPVTLGLRTKNAKIIALCIGSLQRLISLKAISSRDQLPSFIQDLQVASTNSEIDIQLKVLQAVLVILTIGNVYGSVLGDALRILFELRDSRIPVVSSTAAASLRQGVMVTLDRVLQEDKDEGGVAEGRPTTLPDGSTTSLRPSAFDAFNLFQDLCLLTSSSPVSTEKQQLLRLEKLPRPFGLELIESILSNYVPVFKDHPELLLLLHHQLCPLLLQSLSFPATSSFPLTLRLIRVVFLLLRSFSDELVVESEQFLLLLIRLISGDAWRDIDTAGLGLNEAANGGEKIEYRPGGGGGEQVPGWLRVLAMESLRGLCSDPQLFRTIWERQRTCTPPSATSTNPVPSSSPSSSTLPPKSLPPPNIFSLLITTLNRIATEKPPLLGVSSQMNGLGVPHPHHDQIGSPTAEHGSSGGGAGQASSSAAANAYGGLEMVAGMLSSGVSNVVASLTHDAAVGLGDQSMVKVQCIDQLDKLDPPTLPETYIYLLALQSVNLVVEGFSSVVTPAFTHIVPLHTSLEVAKKETKMGREEGGEPEDDVAVVKEMVEVGWPAILAALSWFLGRDLNDELFVDTLASLHEFTIICGLLDLSTERDAFLSTLSRFAIPPSVVSALASLSESSSSSSSYPYKPPSNASSAVLSSVEALGLSALTGGGSYGQQQPPGLSGRNLACLKVLIGVTEMLAGSLGRAWFDVLETLQSSSFVLTPRRQAGGSQMARKGSQLVVPPSPNPRRSSFAPGGGGPSSAPPSISSFQPSHGRRPSLQLASQQHQPPPLSEQEIDQVQASINHVFSSTVSELDDETFTDFVYALCRLSIEMMGLQQHASEGVGGSSTIRTTSQTGSFGMTRAGSTIELNAVVESPKLGDGPAPMRRRASGMHLPKTNRQHGDKSFAISKLHLVASQNLPRLLSQTFSLGLQSIIDHLLLVQSSHQTSSTTRLQAAEALSDLLSSAIRTSSSLSEDVQSRTQHLVLGSLAKMVEPSHAGGGVGHLYGGQHQQQIQAESDIRRLGLEGLYAILQNAGHELVAGWEMVFSCLRSVCARKAVTVSAGSEGQRSPGLQPSGGGKTRLAGVGGGVGVTGGSARSNGALVRSAFQSLTLIAGDFLSSLSIDDLRQCVLTLSDFAHQHDDVNIALSSLGSLWSVGDAVQQARRSTSPALAEDDRKAYDDLWLFILRQLLDCSLDSRAEVRSSSMQTLFRSLELYGSSLDETLWTAVIDEIINPLLDSLASFSSPSITISSETAAEDEEEDEIDPLSQPPPRAVDSSKWHESRTLALQSTGSIFSSFFLSSLSSLPNATQIWSAYLAHLESSFISGVPSVAHASTSSFLKILSAWEDSSSAPSVLTSEMMRSAWESWEKMGEAVVVGSSTNISSSASPSATSTTESFTQETLRTLVLTLKPLLALSPSLWSTDRLRQVLAIIKAVLTHPPGDEIRPDVDNPTPLQAAIFDIFPLFDLSPSGAAAALLQDLSSLITLAYASTFDEETGRGGGAAPAARRITFVAVSKRAMKMSVEVFEARKGEMDIFEKGAAEELIKAFSLPIKLKYDCPSSCRYGSEPPLWKTATDLFLQIVKPISSTLDSADPLLSPETFQAIFKQLLDLYSGALLADCSSTSSLPLDQQLADESYDLRYLTSLESTFLPVLGSPRVESNSILRFAQVLRRASVFYTFENERPDGVGLYGDDDGEEEVVGGKDLGPDGVFGTTAEIEALPRERFRRWCFDFLFLVCRRTEALDTQELDSRKRIASLCLPSLIERTKSVLECYLADAPLRGSLPFPRVREEELVYVLKKLLELELTPGTFASSSVPPNPIISQISQHSHVPHLFSLYPLLLKLLVLPRRPGGIQDSGYVPIGSFGEGASDEERDEVLDTGGGYCKWTLAGECLARVGEELGS